MSSRRMLYVHNDTTRLQYMGIRVSCCALDIPSRVVASCFLVPAGPLSWLVLEALPVIQWVTISGVRLLSRQKSETAT